MALGFEWDRRKARSNLGKHRVFFREAVIGATQAEQEQYEREELRTDR